MQSLKDPCQDRQVNKVTAPPYRPLDNKLMFGNRNNGKPDWKLIKDHLYREGRIEKNSLIKLVEDTNKILRKESNLLQLQDPITIVGDIHGQYYDLCKLLEIGGNPSTTKYIFLGDFVDRGSFSVEVIILLYSLKICYPKTVFFLRGNHECRQMTQFFNFRDEVLYKYDQEVYDILMDSFDQYPISCVINGKFLALHGGISPDIKYIEELNTIDRFQEPPRQGLLCDLLWSDPVDNEQGICDNVFQQNDVRGCSYFFGYEAVNRFINQNGLLSIIRAHEAQIDGYKMHRWKGSGDFPSVITIFSAPNYCDVYNNKGAIIKFKNNSLNIQQFNYTAHPYLLPNFMDIFTWSIPFVSEKVTEMLYHLLKPDENESESDEDSQEECNIPGLKQYISNDNPAIDKKQRQQALKNKIKFVSKMIKMQKVLRQNSEQLVKIKGVCPDKKIPKGLLTEGNDAIQDVMQKFTNAKTQDKINEKRPNPPQYKPNPKK